MGARCVVPAARPHKNEKKIKKDLTICSHLCKMVYENERLTERGKWENIIESLISNPRMS